MIPANTYKVMFFGKTLRDKPIAEVSSRFAAAFKINDKLTLNRLFSGRTLALKRGLNYEQARRYRDILAKMGADCCIERESSPLFATNKVQSVAEYKVKTRRKPEVYSGNYVDQTQTMRIVPKW